MILETTNNITETNITEDIKSFSIEANSIAFNVLSSKLYTNSIVAIVRELLSNAYDSQIVNGNPDKEIEITVPNDLGQNDFIIRDYGTGLSKEDVLNMYTTFFSSTKRTSNNVTGCFGLGSKTPFAYSNTFSIVSYYNGLEMTFVASIIESYPKVICIAEKETTEPNGLKIIIPFNNSDDYYKNYSNRNALVTALDIFLNTNKEIKTNRKKSEYYYIEVFSNSLFTIYTKNIPTFHNLLSLADINIKQGTNIFNSIDHIADNYYKLANMFIEGVYIVIHVDIGSIEITPSREAIENKETNKVIIENKIDEIIAYIINELDEDNIDNSKFYKKIEHFIKNSYDYNINRFNGKINSVIAEYNKYADIPILEYTNKTKNKNSQSGLIDLTSFNHLYNTFIQNNYFTKYRYNVSTNNTTVYTCMKHTHHINDIKVVDEFVISECDNIFIVFSFEHNIAGDIKTTIDKYNRYLCKKHTFINRKTIIYIEFKDINDVKHAYRYLLKLKKLYHKIFSYSRKYSPIQIKTINYNKITTKIKSKTAKDNINKYTTLSYYDTYQNSLKDKKVNTLDLKNYTSIKNYIFCNKDTAYYLGNIINELIRIPYQNTEIETNRIIDFLKLIFKKQNNGKEIIKHSIPSYYQELTEYIHTNLKIVNTNNVSGKILKETHDIHLITKEDIKNIFNELYNYDESMIYKNNIYSNILLDNLRIYIRILKAIPILVRDLENSKEKHVKVLINLIKNTKYYKNINCIYKFLIKNRYRPIYTYVNYSYVCINTNIYSDINNLFYQRKIKLPYYIDKYVELISDIYTNPPARLKYLSYNNKQLIKSNAGLYVLNNENTILKKTVDKKQPFIYRNNGYHKINPKRDLFYILKRLEGDYNENEVF